MARHRLDPAQWLWSASGVRRLRRRAALRRRRGCGSGISAVYCRFGAARTEEAPSLPDVRAHAVPRSNRSAHRWSRRRVLAPRITTMVVSRPHCTYTPGNKRYEQSDRTDAVPGASEEYPHVLMAHGGGGRMTQMLIERIFLHSLRQPGARTTARWRSPSDRRALASPSPLIRS